MRVRSGEFANSLCPSPVARAASAGTLTEPLRRRHYWCETYRRKFRSLGLMCGCIRKKNTGTHGSGVPMKKIWAW